MLKSLGRSSPAQVVDFNSILNRVDYSDVYNGIKDSGVYLLLLPTGFDIKGVNDFMTSAVDAGVNEVIIPYHKNFDKVFIQDKTEVALGRGIKISVLLVGNRFDRLIRQYQDVCKINELHSIVLPRMYSDTAPSGFARLQFMKEIVVNYQFSTDKRHYFMGLGNPAELSAYRVWFSDYVLSSIDLVITSATFMSSLYGVQISRSYGYSLEFEDLIGGDPVLPLCDYSLSDEQIDLFYCNKQAVEGFVKGVGGDVIIERYKRYEEEKL